VLRAYRDKTKGGTFRNKLMKKETAMMLFCGEVATLNLGAAINTSAAPHTVAST